MYEGESVRVKQLAWRGVTGQFRQTFALAVAIGGVARHWKAKMFEVNANLVGAAGVQVRLFSPKAALYIHAKMILADNSQAFVGSENFSYTSLRKNRELGIILTKSTILKSLSATFSADFSKATEFQK